MATARSDVGRAPHVDVVYKLVEDRHGPKMKTSTGKETLPGVKQVARTVEDGVMTGDTIGLGSEELTGDLLLAPVMAGGQRLS